MPNYRKMMEQWKDWRLDPDSTLREAGSLPTTVKAVNSPKLKKAKPPKNAKRGKQFIKHHKFHSGPHITGAPAELSTYDFDDDDYEVEGGLQKRKNKQKRGYEPVEEKINMGFAGYKNYFTNIERNMNSVDRSIKTLIKDLPDDGHKKESIELMKLYKKYFIELKVKFTNFKRKNT